MIETTDQRIRTISRAPSTNGAAKHHITGKTCSCGFVAKRAHEVGSHALRSLWAFEGVSFGRVQPGNDEASFKHVPMRPDRVSPVVERRRLSPFAYTGQPSTDERLAQIEAALSKVEDAHTKGG